ncbi:MAG: TetR/AcrR family transcriptional regulator [Acidimicrobiia bacterium]|nr:TetR/AcrR family transcriptional regulator [Acidimicrobiia bacterium]
MREFAYCSLMTSSAARAALAALAETDTGDVPEDDDRLRVLDAALAAFMEFGIRRTSMGEIFRRSGVSPATLYRWFGTEEGIVHAVVLGDLRGFAADLDAATDLDAPPEDQLTDLAVGVARRLRSPQLLLRLIETEPETVLPQLTVDAAPLIDLGVAVLAGHLRRLSDEGRIATPDPVLVAEIFVRLFHSLSLTPSTNLPLDDEAHLREFARDVVRRVITPPIDNDR